MSKLMIYENVIAVLEGPEGRMVIPGRNIITSVGDIYYAQKAVDETPTNDFTLGGVRLGSGSTAPAKADTDVTSFITGLSIAESATYPKTNDVDLDNSGRGVSIVTWLYEFTTVPAGTGIIEGAIVDNIVTPTAALCHFLFANVFDKKGVNTLKLFINHIFLGA